MGATSTKRLFWLLKTGDLDDTDHVIMISLCTNYILNDVGCEALKNAILVVFA